MSIHGSKSAAAWIRTSIVRILTCSAIATIALIATVAGAAAADAPKPQPKRIEGAYRHHSSPLVKELAEKGLELGQPIFIRAYKTDGDSPHSGALTKSARLEVWVRGSRQQYELFKTFPICALSGKLGPKLKDGDLQVPEGVYELRPEGANPESAFHISYDVGFPNAVDRARGATGSQIRIHGKCQSWGCLALGFSKKEDEIEQLTVLIHDAWKRGQKRIPVHIFPFPLTDENISENLRSKAGKEKTLLERHWNELKPIHEHFENQHTPPTVKQEAGHYKLVL